MPGRVKTKNKMNHIQMNILFDLLHRPMTQELCSTIKF